MPITHVLKRLQIANRRDTAWSPFRHVCTLCLLLLLAVVISILLIGATPPRDDRIVPFMYTWMIAFLPYFAGCAFVLMTQPLEGHWHWIELVIILLGALILRVMLLPLPPGLSHDSWRYLWDARVTLHGFSPYVYAPVDKALRPLVDNVLFPNSRFRTAPTIYPPGAQVIFLLSYVLAPANLFFLKGIFLIFDMATCIALISLLKRRGLDERRVILYAWCPLPIVEFAVEGHVDVITLTFSILALLSAANTSRRGRILTGFLVGMATLTRLYPILLLAVVLPPLAALEPGENDHGMLAVRRVLRGGTPLLITCFATILLGYLPYLILGHGQVLGYFTIYANQQGQNAGVTQLIVQLLGYQMHLPIGTTITLEHIVGLVLVGSAAVTVFVLRTRNRMSAEVAALLLFGSILSISSHVFPWYTTVLLLWVPLAFVPLWTPRGLSGKAMAVLAAWYFTIASLLNYFDPVSGNPAPNWTVYYIVVYTPVVIALGVAAIVGLLNLFRQQKGIDRATNHNYQ
jgi:Glycosyltransferase family 87